jgi:putative pyruvate formate lyase activating enzyme
MISRGLMGGSWPAYLELYERGALLERVERGLELLGRRTGAQRPTCRVCPRFCRVARLEDQVGYCRVGRYAAVSSYFPHFGEEDCLRGWRGSGTVFFTSCNLRCVFCQNWEISQLRRGQMVSPEELAKVFLRVHVVPQILEALALAIPKGLRLPIVYNTSAYDGPESLELMDDIVDIYMPDFKFWDPQLAYRYVGARNYPEVARHSIKEMHRQVGDLEIDPDTGLARRGLLVRHLVMPGFVEDSRKIFHWLATEVSRDTYINVMAQYYPAGNVVLTDRYQELRRTLTRQEYLQALEYAREAGLWRFDVRQPALFR